MNGLLLNIFRHKHLARHAHAGQCRGMTDPHAMTANDGTLPLRARVFVIGGAAETVPLCRGLLDDGATVALALETAPRSGGPIPGAISAAHLGQDDAALCAQMQAADVDAVIDVTHPFSEVPARAWPLCRDMGLPYLRLRRPAWEPGPGDRWTTVADTAHAARLLPAGARVLVTTGRGSLGGFSNLRGGHLFVRQLGPPRPVPDIRNATFRFETGPFSVAHERDVLRELGITAIVCNNSGGTTSRSKIDAARALGVPVFLRARPGLADGTGHCAPEVDGVTAACGWFQDQAGVS